MERKEYLVCIDSDGCVIDSMNIKHKHCFGPAFVDVWELEKDSESILNCWNRINLFSTTRGINRFKGLSMILNEYHLENPADMYEFTLWTREAPELSNQALAEICRSSGNRVFSKALKWSFLVNERIEKLPVSPPFDGAAECIGRMHELANIAVVSSANKEAILLEWSEGGLMKHVDYVFSQSDGSKSECIGKMVCMGYNPQKILMVGDAPGDYQAAKSNGIWFFPVLAGEEEGSWKKLKEKYFSLFVSGQFQESVQQDLRISMERNLQ